MKYLLSFFSILLFALPAFAQNDTVYYRETMRTTHTDYFTRYRVVSPMNEDKRYHVKEYDKNHRLSREFSYRSYHLEPIGELRKDTFDGKYIVYDTTGHIISEVLMVNGKGEGKRTEYYQGTTQIRYVGEVKNGKRNGEFYNYYPSGKIKRKEQYKDDFFLRGKKYNEEGKKIKYTRYIREPDPRISIYRWLMYNLRYPKEEKEKGVEGTVIIAFTVDEKGNVTELDILKSDSEAFSKEAKRVIKALPRWKPLIKDDVPQRFRFTQLIRFVL